MVLRNGVLLMDIWRIKPTYQDYVWGGTKLKERYNAITDKDKVAEVWALSCHPDGPNTIMNGEFAGMILQDVLSDKKYWGNNGQRFERFPIITKLLDAKLDLSIQVHPDDELGWELEKEYGKTEAWYVLEADETTALYFGMAKDMTKEEFRAAIENNTLLDCLNKLPVKRGDVLFVEAGTIHALCIGAVIVEVQQNSNTTYRIYDHNRIGNDGKLRELHIEKSILASNLNKFTPNLNPAGEPTIINGATVTLIAECKYFIEELYQIEKEATIDIDEDSFRHILAIKDGGVIITDDETYDFVQGDSFFVPAQKGTITVKGNCELIISRV